MYYGFYPTPFDDELFKAMKDFCASLSPDKHEMFPYVESGNGVRIRRITHYSDEKRREIVNVANKIYEQVLEVQPEYIRMHAKAGCNICIFHDPDTLWKDATCMHIGKHPGHYENGVCKWLEIGEPRKKSTY